MLRIDRVQHHRKILEPTETGIVMTKVTLDPGIKEVQQVRTYTQTPIQSTIR